MKLNYDCWIVVYSDREKTTQVPISLNAHECLFAANAITGRGVGRMTKITAAFQNVWFGNRHKNRKGKEN